MPENNIKMIISGIWNIRGGCLYIFKKKQKLLISKILSDDHIWRRKEPVNLSIRNSPESSQTLNVYTYSHKESKDSMIKKIYDSYADISTKIKEAIFIM